MCWGLLLIRWRRVFLGVTLLTGLSLLITWCPIRVKLAWLLFIYTQSWKWQNAGSWDRNSNTATVQLIVLLQRVPINTMPLLTQTYTSSHTHAQKKARVCSIFKMVLSFFHLNWYCFYCWNNISPKINKVSLFYNNYYSGILLYYFFLFSNFMVFHRLFHWGRIIILDIF